MTGIAVVGAGHWGKNIVRNFASLPDASLLYVCDLQEKVRETMGSLYPDAKVVETVNAALDDDAVEAVAIAVDAPNHFEVARQCIEAGRHTYVEKPLTLSGAEAAKLTDLAAAKGVRLMVGHLMEYHPSVEYMKQTIADGTVGEPLYLYLQRLNLGIVRQVENAWWSLAPHDVSIACWLFEAEPVSVSATGHAYLQNGVEDVVFANLKFADGRMAHIHVSWLDPHKIRKVTLVGSEKMVVFDDMQAGEKIRIYDKGADVRRTVGYAEAITLRTGDIRIPKVPAGEPLKLECQHFLDRVKDGETPRSDGADGIRVVKVLEAGTKSLAAGGEPVSL